MSKWVRIKGIRAYWSNGTLYAYDRETGARLKNSPAQRGGRWYANKALQDEISLIRNKTPDTESLSAMTLAYKDHAVSVSGRRAFCDLSVRTQADYERDFLRLHQAILQIDGSEVLLETVSPAVISTAVCRALRDGWANKYGSTQTKQAMAACRVLWSYGFEYGWVTSNPWKAIANPLPSKSGSANPPWTATELLEAISTAPFPGLARAYVLCFCGVRPQQVIQLTLKQVHDGFKADKTGAEHSLFIPQIFHWVFEGQRTSVMAVTNAQGVPYKKYGALRSSFNKHRKRMAQDGLARESINLKGLNHTLGSALKETGASEEEMMAAMAKSAEMVRHYSRRADRKKHSEMAFGRLSNWFGLSKERKEVSKGENS